LESGAKGDHNGKAAKVIATRTANISIDDGTESLLMENTASVSKQLAEIGRGI